MSDGYFEVITAAGRPVIGYSAIKGEITKVYLGGEGHQAYRINERDLEVLVHVGFPKGTTIDAVAKQVRDKAGDAKAVHKKEDPNQSREISLRTS